MGLEPDAIREAADRRKKVEIGVSASQAAAWVRQVAQDERDRIVRSIETMETVDPAKLVDMQKELAVLRRFARRVETDIATGRRAVEEARDV